jgi:hypothetical protein
VIKSRPYFFKIVAVSMTWNEDGLDKGDQKYQLTATRLYIVRKVIMKSADQFDTSQDDLEVRAIEMEEEK